jgi:hypothetical protein
MRELNDRKATYKCWDARFSAHARTRTPWTARFEGLPDIAFGAAGKAFSPCPSSRAAPSLTQQIFRGGIFGRLLT